MQAVHFFASFAYTASMTLLTRAMELLVHSTTMKGSTKKLRTSDGTTSGSSSWPWPDEHTCSSSSTKTEVMWSARPVMAVPLPTSLARRRVSRIPSHIGTTTSGCHSCVDMRLRQAWTNMRTKLMNLSSLCRSTKLHSRTIVSKKARQ